MKEFILISSKPGGGVNMVAVNLAIGLSSADYHVQLSSRGKKLNQWLTSAGSRQNSLLERNPGLTWFDFDNCPPEKEVDCLLIIPGEKHELKKALANQDALLLCIVDMTSDDSDSITGVNQAIKDIDPQREIDLFIPNKVHPGEWEKSSATIFELAEKFGWEKMADVIPHCEAIHDLPKERQSVWELPDNYSNRKAAFQSLVSKVSELSRS